MIFWDDNDTYERIEWQWIFQQSYWVACQHQVNVLQEFL